MVGARVGGEVDRPTQSTAFRVPGSKDHLANPRLHQCPGAHGTGFQRHNQGALIQPPVSEDPGGLSNRDELSMAQRI